MPVNSTLGNSYTSTTAFGGNIVYRGIQWRSPRKPESYVYLFNVSPRTFEDEKGRGIIGRIKIRAPGVTESDPHLPGDPMLRYHFVTSFPQPMLMGDPDDQTGEVRPVEQDAVRFVVDQLNPDNVTRSLDIAVPPEQVFSVNNDYSQRGLFFDIFPVEYDKDDPDFFTKHPVNETELRKAYARMERYFTRLLEEAGVLEMTDKNKLSERLAGNPDYTFAANYFGKDVTWNRKNIRPVECPNCGEPKPAGRLFHKTSFGSLCVEQTEAAWKAAVNSGIKRYDEVPDDFKWKGKEGKKSLSELAETIKH